MSYVRQSNQGTLLHLMEGIHVFLKERQTGQYRVLLVSDTIIIIINIY